MKVCIETITPNVAKEYLAKNTANYRGINQRAVDRYAKDIADGLWEENGNSISFSKSGVLLNGQHRLSAIVKAGIPVNIVVVRDVDDKATAFDYQAKRSDAQILKAAGLEGYSRSQQAISMAAMLINGQINIDQSSSRTSVSHKRLFLQKNEVEIDAVSQAVFCGNKKTMVTKKAAILCAGWCLFINGESCEDIKAFFSIVNSGFPIEHKECSPCIVLRNQLVSEKGKGGSSRFAEKDFISVIRAYLDFVNGNKRKAEYYGSFPYARKLFDHASKIAMEEIEA